MQKFFRILVALSVPAALFFAAGCAVKSNTLNSLLLAAQALNDKDYKAFNKYVNVDRIVDQCVTLLLDEAKKKTGKKERRLLKLGEKFARPYLVEETKKQFRHAVENGTLVEDVAALQQLPSSKLMFSLIGLFGVPRADEENYQILEVGETKNGESLKVQIKFEGE